MSKETGGPAFPTEGFIHPQDGEQILPQRGMTLRDYFAAAALRAMIGKSGTHYPDTWSTPGTQNYIAQCSYALADAMLTERTKP